MNFEEARQQHARRVSQVWPGAALDLRQVRLAETSAHFFLERAGEILLGHLAAEPAQRAFDEAQVSKFFAEFHQFAGRGTPGVSASHNYYDLQLPYCNPLCKRGSRVRRAGIRRRPGSRQVDTN